MFYCQDLSRKRPRPDLTLLRLNVNKVLVSIMNGIECWYLLRKRLRPDLTVSRQILTWHDQKLKLSIPSRQSIPNIKKVLVTILISIDFQYLMRKRTKPDLFLLRPILISSNQKLALSFVSRQSILNVNKVLVLILIGINFQYLLRTRRRSDLTLSRYILMGHDQKLKLSILFQ